MWSNTQAKLAQLRAKTDRDLAVLLRSLMESSLRALHRDDYAEADAGYTQAAKLLPLTHGFSGQDTGALKDALAELRAELDKTACPCSL